MVKPHANIQKLRDISCFWGAMEDLRDRSTLCAIESEATLKTDAVRQFVRIGADERDLQ